VTEAVRPRRRWIEPRPVSPADVDALRESLQLPPLLCQLLVRRGCRDPDAARDYLRPRLETLSPPESLPDLTAAVDRIQEAIASEETILVHGDYDVDGMTAAALLYRGLRELGGRVDAFVPHRLRDGYDLGAAGLARAEEMGAGIILTADCGMTAVETVDAANVAGLDVIVTDHHRPGLRLPAALAIVNPHRADSEYPFDGLTGVGVAFKLLTALHRKADRSAGSLNRHLDLVAIGTIADRGPLVGENRILVRAGLSVLARTRNRGLWALMEAARVTPFDNRVVAEDVAFQLAPRLNAAGRVGAAEEGLRLLVTEDVAEAEALAWKLEDHNRRRRATDRQVTEEAEAQLRERFDPEHDSAFVLWSDDWHPGVLGIVASRIAERFCRPTVVISFDGDLGRGSARSAGGANLIGVLDECSALLERYGGHREAAGLDVRREALEEFRRRFIREVSALSTGAVIGDDPVGALPAGARPVVGEVQELEIDLQVTLAEAEDPIHTWLRHLEPFGFGNPRPVLLARAVRFDDLARVGADGSHLRASILGEEGGRLPAIGFGMGDRAAELREGSWDLAFELVEDQWQGRRRTQARLLDARGA
jgi:single-stranded-DNA-specific exonuclease